MEQMSRSIYVLILAIRLVYGDWDPEYCLADYDITALKNPYYVRTKEEVTHYLRGTWCSAEKVGLIMDLIYVTKPEFCVEIGVMTGSSLLPMAVALSLNDSGIAVGVDAWSNTVAIRNMDSDDPNRPWWSWVNLDEAYETLQTRLYRFGVESFCDTIHSTSENAASLLDEIDFLHLDGDYTEKGSLRDVQLYLPKVKSGGYILLSNLFIMVKGKAPKMKAFAELFDACEMICEIDRDNTVLFRKN